MDRVTRIRDLEIETSPHFPRGPKLQYPAYAGPFEMPPRNYAQWPSLPQRISCPSPAVWRPAETSANPSEAPSPQRSPARARSMHLSRRLPSSRFLTGSIPVLALQQRTPKDSPALFEPNLGGPKAAP